MTYTSPSAAAGPGDAPELESLQAGANDFVTKPVNAAVLRARIDTHLRLHSLRRELEATPGFISVERFESLAEPGKILSLSFFSDEAAVEAWRGRPAHRAGQSEGRASIFADYRLRIADVVRDYGMRDRADAPADSRRFHESGD